MILSILGSLRNNSFLLFRKLFSSLWAFETCSFLSPLSIIFLRLNPLREIMADKEAAEKQLEEKMDRWVYLNDLAERIEAQKNNG